MVTAVQRHSLTYGVEASAGRMDGSLRVAGPLCLQVALTCTQIWWTTEVGMAFARLEEGYENAIKDYNKKQVCGPRGPHESARAPGPSPGLCPSEPRWVCPRATPVEIHGFHFLSGNHHMLPRVVYFF